MWVGLGFKELGDIMWVLSVLLGWICKGITWAIVDGFLWGFDDFVDNFMSFPMNIWKSHGN